MTFKFVFSNEAKCKQEVHLLMTGPTKRKESALRYAF